MKMKDPLTLDIAIATTTRGMRFIYIVAHHASDARGENHRKTLDSLNKASLRVQRKGSSVGFAWRLSNRLQQRLVLTRNGSSSALVKPVIRDIPLPQFVGLRRGFLFARRSKSSVAGKSSLQTAPVCSAGSGETQVGKDKVHIADLNKILEERDACGVGFIANLANERNHKIVEDALTALGCMEHRGACSADNDSGDGAGIMTQIPWDLVNAFLKDEGLPACNESSTGVGMIFLPQEEEKAAEARAITESVLADEGLKLLAWRKVPVVDEVVGEYAKATQPIIEQIIVESTSGCTEDELERALMMARKVIEKKTSGDPVLAENFYFCSFSGRTIVYKGMLRSVVVGAFYKDLKDPLYTTAFAIYHRRFSTNTTPKWPLAQPMRILGHNGEINTLQGNLNWMASREALMTAPVWEGREPELRPICNTLMSDSANLDRTAEMYYRSGTPLDQTLMLLVPEAYENHPTLDARYPEAKGFYQYYAGLQEGWDGPALVVFSDGRTVGARLDRNGLRPARFWQTSDGYLYVASEVGVLGDVMTNAENVVAKGRLGPGMMVTTELGSGTFNRNSAVAKKVSSAKPFGEWVKAAQSSLPPAEPLIEMQMSSAECLKLQKATGYSGEDVGMIIESMALEGKEPTFCMGDDTPLAVLSGRPHLLYDYFKQRFAQVTNPAIDPLREGLVMSLVMHIGAKGNVLNVDESILPKMCIKSPVLFEKDLEAIVSKPELKATTLPIRFPGDGEKGTLKAALEDLCAAAAEAVNDGAEVLVLSDRPDGELSVDSPAIPALLATGAVHHHLIQSGLRFQASIVVESAQAFSTQHIACLVGYGASAVCPYLALETCRQYQQSARTQKLISSGKLPAITIDDVQLNLRSALNAGLKKILSKMGISLLSTYCGAQIFEIYGLGQDVVDTSFKGSVSRIGGLSLDELAAETENFWKSGFPEEEIKKLDNFGFFQVRPGLEYHGNNGQMSKILHQAIGLGGKATDAEAAKLYKETVRSAPVSVLRDMLEIVSDREAIPLEEVESVEKIMERFCTGGMSLGAISRETHETIAIAMNRIGGKSNSGEGGEDPQRYIPVADADDDGNSPTFPHLTHLENGDVASSAIKQVASGRFGVTPYFLMNAEQIEIKVAQGAKPGEGGQLPGKKVSPYIATLRSSKPGVPLISPPPHHDIYSIEDLSQLIYDLHMVNPKAKVSVKLVAEAGIGTVASGVAKANADIIQVSGHDGGTGASPVSSIKHAGGPWEMGLAESHQTLLANGLRDRVVLRTDGGYKTGHDVMMSALMGADEYGFGTVAMIATGCVMARICHTNNCPVGVASQREELRARFPGAPGDLVNYFHDVAQEIRMELASMGYASLQEVIGRADLLKQADTPLAKTKGLDLSFLTNYLPEVCQTVCRDHRDQPPHSNGPVLDDKILEMEEVAAAIEGEDSCEISLPIVNIDRAAVTRVSGAVAGKYGDNGFAGSIKINFEGSAGQSFCAMLCGGLDVNLVGEANDYVGKSMAGGSIAISPPPDSPFDASEAVLVGNTCLYGATGGRMFVNGLAGERFAVRNSLAQAVVEGTGDHCCEYMTGGCIVVLGKVGRNVGAGMTGGLGYFLDLDDNFLSKVNSEIVRAQRIKSDTGAAQLQGLIEEHVAKTGSAKGQMILDNWDEMREKFWQVVPPSEMGTPEVVDEPTAKANVSA
ncbi:hypothetical protein CYMTET_40777 [Cymbomonas tetramitiformis]|uniref:glutamate synthase (ferredoxin) n=1 Tax=Cymbomonas tetramitiformis TaxID=36881 RepID=A0AAE0C8Q2_9CHLO|nr:hypothetical protein CYMTET_40777 [Cymbomonas tetramitiformis]